MKKTDDIRRNFFILNRLGKSLWHDLTPLEPLPLDVTHERDVKRLNIRRNEIFKKIIEDISKMGQSGRDRFFSLDGEPLIPEATEWLESYSCLVRHEFEKLPFWLRSLFFRTDDLADFSAGDEQNYYTIEELVWLSFGLQFTKRIEICSEAELPLWEVKSRPNTGKFILKRLKLFEREFGLKHTTQEVKISEVLSFVRDQKDGYNSDFLEFLELLRLKSKSKKPGVHGRSATAYQERLFALSLSKPIELEADQGKMEKRLNKLANRVVSEAAALGFSPDEETFKKELLAGYYHHLRKSKN